MRIDLCLTCPDAETLTLSVPTDWNDVSLQQFIDWQCCDEPAACVLAGIRRDQLERLAWADAGYLLHLLAFAAELPDPPVSPDLREPGSATYGQLLLAQQHVEQHPDQPDIFYAPYLYALYRSREIFGRYDEAKIEACRQAILQEPVGRCFGDVTFIWAAWLLSTSATPPPPKTLPNPTTPSTMPAWKSWATGLGRYLPWTPWPTPSAAPGPSSTNSMPIRS